MSMTRSFDDGDWLSKLVQNPLWNIWHMPEAELTPPQRTFVRVWAVICEVNNGGFNQYFFNSYSAHAGQAANSFREIGADVAAGIVERACNAFGPTGPSADHKIRQTRLDEIDPNRGTFLRREDDEFIAQSDDIDRKLFEYVTANVAHFAGAAELLA